MKEKLIIITLINAFIFFSILNFQLGEKEIKEFNLNVKHLAKSEVPVNISIAGKFSANNANFASSLANDYNIILNLLPEKEGVFIKKDINKNAMFKITTELDPDSIIIGLTNCGKCQDRYILSSKEDLNDYEKIAILRTVKEQFSSDIKNNSFIDRLNKSDIKLDSVHFKTDVFKSVSLDNLKEKKVSGWAIIGFEIFFGISLIFIFLLIFENVVEGIFPLVFFVICSLGFSYFFY